jgi:protein phosphatase
VLALGAFAGWSYLRSQYFVGVDGEQVAVFRGVNTSVAGVALSDVEERTDLDVERLDSIARAQVEKGWVADGRDDADSYVERLQERAAPDCPEPTAGTGTPTPAPGAFPEPPADPTDLPCAEDGSS